MSKSILYIEDDAINALVIKKLLGTDFEVHHTEDGESGLSTLSTHTFNLILMDINLGKGKMDGIETMKRLKLLPGYERVPVMAVTSYALPEDERRFKSQGFDDYLAKPVDRVILLERIRQLLEQGATHDLPTPS